MRIDLSSPLVHLAACVLGPAAWGVVMYLVFEGIDRRRRRFRPDERPPVDYSI